jgi:hypothetical protein
MGSQARTGVNNGGDCNGDTLSLLASVTWLFNGRAAITYHAEANGEVVEAVVAVKNPGNSSHENADNHDHQEHGAHYDKCLGLRPGFSTTDRV